jgi:hypothetical protein
VNNQTQTKDSDVRSRQGNSRLLKYRYCYRMQTAPLSDLPIAHRTHAIFLHLHLYSGHTFDTTVYRDDDVERETNNKPESV